MPRTQQQWNEIRESRRALIMETALELFASEGYYPTSISKISKKAGISKGLMYNYFTSKEQLVREIIDHGLQDLLSAFDPDRDGVLTDKEFEFMVNAIFAILRQNKRYWKFYFSLIIQAPVHEMIREGFARLALPLLQTQIRYYEKKGVPDPRTEAIFFAAVLDGIAFNFIIDPDHFPIEKIKNLIIEKFSYIPTEDYEN